MESLQSVVIGAGQAGLSSAHHLQRLGLRPHTDYVVLDGNDRPGGAWQHRWPSLTMRDVHGVADLPGMPVPETDADARANAFVPDYFAEYETTHALPVVRPVQVERVEDADGDLLQVGTDQGRWLTRTVINATGTWERPFVPRYPGAGTFGGRQLHTYAYAGPDEFAGQRVLVVGGGASAVQLLAELSDVADTVWVTRRPPVWRTSEFTPEAGRAAVQLVEDRVRRGLPPRSVVSVTGLMLREQERAAEERGVYRRRPMFSRITPTGADWADGSHEDVDVILWATGFRPDVQHLAPLHLRTPEGGIQLDGTEAVRDPRIQLVGYGPSASTIGANRAGRVAARNVLRQLGDRVAA